MKIDMTGNHCWSWFLLISCFSSLLVCPGALAIKIGAIINTDSKDGRQLQTGLEVAAQLFNSSTHRFFLNIMSSGKDPLHAASIASELISEWRAEAIVSSGTWSQVAIVADVGRRAKIPVIYLSTTPPPVPLVPRSYFVQMSYSSSMIVRCLTDLIRSYEWRSITILYEEDDEYVSISGGIIMSVSGALRGIGAVIEEVVVFPSLDSSLAVKNIVRKEMERVMVSQLCRVFVVLRSSPLLTYHLFEEGRRLGLTKAGSAWIVVDNGVDSILEMGEKHSSSYISSTVEGVIGVKPYFNETSMKYQMFHSIFRERYPSKHQELGISAVYGHDAIQAITEGMAESKKRRTTLVEGILKSKFEGLSGSIQFGNDGIRLLENNSLAFQVINFVGKGYREMGFWSEGAGLCKQKDVSVNSLLPVFWPGEQIKVPGGWGKLRVGVPGDNNVFDVRFVMVDYDHNGKPRLVSGFSIDVFKAILNKLKYDLDFEFLPHNGSYDDLIQQVALKRFDIAIGDITIVAERMRSVEFTMPYTESSAAMLVRTKRSGNGWLLLNPFSKGLLGLILASFIYTTLIVWYLEMRSVNVNSPGAEHVRFGTTLWLMFFTIFFHFNEVRSRYTKFIMVVWLFAVLIITQTFTASLSSVLTTEKLEPQLDISRVAVNLDAKYLVEYLENVMHFSRQNIQKILKMEDYHNAFRSGKINAAFMEVPYMRIFLSLYKDYTIYGESQKLGGFGIVFPKSSSLVADFNKAILQLLEDGTLKDLEKKWFSFAISNCPSTENYINTDGVTVDNLWGLFLLIGAATTIAFLFAISHSLRAQCLVFLGKRYVLTRDGCKRLWRSNKFFKCFSRECAHGDQRINKDENSS